ncbi:hypothetical protein RJ641_035218, partial [Dillenia turbinata]
MAKTFTLLETLTISAVFSAVSSWYGFMIGRENARRELGAIIDELRNSTSRAIYLVTFYKNMYMLLYTRMAFLSFLTLFSLTKPTYRPVLLESLSESLMLLPPSDIPLTNSTRFRHFQSDAKEKMSCGSNLLWVCYLFQFPAHMPAGAVTNAMMKVNNRSTGLRSNGPKVLSMESNMVDHPLHKCGRLSIDAARILASDPSGQSN